METTTRAGVPALRKPVVGLLALALMAAAYAPPAAAEERVTICHRTASLQMPVVTMTVNGNSLEAHITNHGDFLATLGPNGDWVCTEQDQCSITDENYNELSHFDLEDARNKSLPIITVYYEPLVGNGLLDLLTVEMEAEDPYYFFRVENIGEDTPGQVGDEWIWDDIGVFWLDPNVNCTADLDEQGAFFVCHGQDGQVIMKVYEDANVSLSFETFSGGEVVSTCATEVTIIDTGGAAGASLPDGP